MNHSVSATQIQHRIYLIRDQKVMLDRDLAEIYGVSTKRLNEHVKRNRRRFPSDFVFQLTEEETAELMRSQNATAHLKSQIATSRDISLRSQNATLKDQSRRGKHSKYLPFAFTEHGAVMLACILKSSIAMDASVHVVRAFNRLKELFVEHKDLSEKLGQVEKRLSVHDHQIQTVFQAISKLQKHPRRRFPRLKPKPPIGFRE